jgi:ubiquinone/menaquinone biosynthesis C-methylase UbiE
MLAQERFSEAGVVADLGAGPVDASTEWLRPADGQRGPTVVSLDAFASGLEQNPGKFRIVAVAEALPLRDGCLDGVLARYVFEHLEHPDAVLGEVRRVLRPGGACVFVTPHAGYYVSVCARFSPMAIHLAVRRWLGQSESTIYISPTFYRMNTPRRLRILARSAGLKLTHVEIRVGPPTYTQVLPMPLHRAFVAWHCLLERSPRLRAWFGVSLLGVLTRPAERSDDDDRPGVGR